MIASVEMYEQNRMNVYDSDIYDSDNTCIVPYAASTFPILILSHVGRLLQPMILSNH